MIKFNQIIKEHQLWLVSYITEYVNFYYRLDPKPHILIGHFFAVALYAVYFSFKSEDWWTPHKAVVKSIGIFYSACGVLFPLIWSEMKTVIRY